MTTIEKPLAYREDGLIVFRASGFMNCVKALTAALMKIPPAPPAAVLRKAFAEGHEWEDYIIDQTSRHYQHDVVWQQDEVNLPIGKRYLIRGHLDGAMELGHGLAIVDAKALGESYSRSIMTQGLEGMGPLGVKYAAQGLIYCLATGAEIFILACMDKSTIETEPDPFVYFYEFTLDDLWEISGLSKGKLRSRFAAVEKAAKDGDILNAECLAEVFGCPYYHLHDGQMNDDPLWVGQDEVSDADAYLLGSLVAAEMQSRLDLEVAKETAQATKITLANYIEKLKPAPEELNDGTKDEVAFTFTTDEGVKVTRYQSKSKSLNKKAVKDAGINLDPYYTESPYTAIKLSGGSDESS